MLVGGGGKPTPKLETCFGSLHAWGLGHFFPAFQGSGLRDVTDRVCGVNVTNWPGTGFTVVTVSRFRGQCGCSAGSPSRAQLS